MNFALSDEQELLREAARGTLSRHKTLEAAREALDGELLPDLWPTATEAGWPGLLISEEHGGAGLGALDAMLVFAELGRVLAAVPLLGHVTATLVLDGAADPELLARLASGEQRAALVAARPPDDVETRWTVDARLGASRVAAPSLDGERLSGGAAWVPDAPGADWLVVVTEGAQAVLVEASAAQVEPVPGYDATRSLGHVDLDGVRGTVLDVDPERLAAAWYVSQCLLGAECVGAVEHTLEMSVDYAKERFTFGRAIGSYQAVKHHLVEVLRRLENSRSLMLYAGWAAGEVQDGELPLAAAAFRFAAGEALEVASRINISVHGGIGATWEHDAPLFFRRAQLSRRLLGGTAGGAERVAAELFSAARALPAT